MWEAIISRLTRRNDLKPEPPLAKPVEPGRLTQAHFGMMRAIDFLGGYWSSSSYCPWRVGRTYWESSDRRWHVHEILLNDENRARHQQDTVRAYGPNRQVCIALCEDLVKRGFVDGRPGNPKGYVLTARGYEVIGTKAQLRS